MTRTHTGKTRGHTLFGVVGICNASKSSRKAANNLHSCWVNLPSALTAACIRSGPTNPTNASSWADPRMGSASNSTLSSHSSMSLWLLNSQTDNLPVDDCEQTFACQSNSNDRSYIAVRRPRALLLMRASPRRLCSPLTAIMSPLSVAHTNPTIRAQIHSFAHANLGSSTGCGVAGRLGRGCAFGLSGNLRAAAGVGAGVGSFGEGRMRESGW
mmetsp:Transcript_40955/g.92749  ORF Transcript_40955/g.92749 Transcript_40955/m.92749 type:complete len:213 (-) Transcript_40955:381-1019(-)